MKQLYEQLLRDTQAEGVPRVQEHNETEVADLCQQLDQQNVSDREGVRASTDKYGAGMPPRERLGA